MSRPFGQYRVHTYLKHKSFESHVLRTFYCGISIALKYRSVTLGRIISNDFFHAVETNIDLCKISRPFGQYLVHTYLKHKSFESHVLRRFYCGISIALKYRSVTLGRIISNYKKTLVECLTKITSRNIYVTCFIST